MGKINDRWESGKPHHSLALKFRKFIDKTGIDDECDWKFGGDGDNGEDVLFALSEFFESKDFEKAVRVED